MDNIERLKDALKCMEKFTDLLIAHKLERYVNYYGHNQIKIVIEELEKLDKKPEENLGKCTGKSLEEQFENTCVKVNKSQYKELMKAFENYTPFLWTAGGELPTEWDAYSKIGYDDSAEIYISIMSDGEISQATTKDAYKIELSFDEVMKMLKRSPKKGDQTDQEEYSVDCKIDSPNKSLEDQLEGICVLVNKTQAEKLLKAVELCTCYTWSFCEGALPTKFIPNDDFFFLYFDFYGRFYRIHFGPLRGYEGQPLTEFDKVMQIIKDFCKPCQ